MLIKRFFQKLGFDLRFYPTKSIRSRQSFMKSGGFNTILDVGANSGQFVFEVRNEYKFKGKILSFEPISDVFVNLKQKLGKDKNWVGFNFALGNVTKSEVINISKHTPSSSILPFNHDYIRDNTHLSTTKEEVIQIKEFKEIANEFNFDEDSRILLKVDTQGYEMNVLRGCGEYLKLFRGIQIECSIKELYVGESLYSEIFDYLLSNQFSLFTLEPTYYDQNTMELLQIEAYFVNTRI
jgi:FkbM family methyltransferase